jgi:uncharacterized OB-fold protein
MDMYDRYFEDLFKRQDEYLKNRGEPTGWYSEDACPNCGRHRLLVYKYCSICEKCNWNTATNTYDFGKPID